jgi:PST family polysaccharide transporter
MDGTLKKNFSYLFLLQTANYLIPLILLPYLTHVLGAENFGKISFVQAFIAYFILLTDYGFNTSATQQVVQVRENKKELSAVFWTTTFTKILFGLLGIVVLTILLGVSSKLREMNQMIWIAFSGVLASVLFPVWLFQGMEKMSYITWLNVLPKLIVLGFTFFLIRQKSDYVMALAIQSAGTLIAALACSVLIFRKALVELYIPSFQDIKNALLEGWHIFASSMATNFYTTTNTVVLGLVANNSAVGVFAASEKIIRSFVNLFSSISQVTFPRINSYLNDSREKALNFGTKILKYTAFISTTAGLMILLLAPWIVKLLFGVPQFSETISILRISSFLPFFSLCNGILAVNLLITFGLKQYLLKIVGTGGFFSMLLVLPAVYFYQGKGVAVVAVLTEILIMGLLFSVFRKHQIKII